MDATFSDSLSTDSEGAKKLSPLLVDSEGKEITTIANWEARKAELRHRWRDFLGSLNVKRDEVPVLNVIEEDSIDGVIRQLVRYEIEPGIYTEAYLLKPAKLQGKAPGVVVFHSTAPHSIRQPAGVEGKPEKAFGLKLAQLGCVAFCPRNYLCPNDHQISPQQEAERFLKRHPQAKGMAKMLFDAQVAVDILAQQPEVDENRLGAIGHSLGAKEAFYIAAFDERIQVTVSSEGGVGVTMSNWDAPWYLGKEVQELEFDLEHHELLALIAPRAFLLVGGNGADGDESYPYIQSALPIYQLYGEPTHLWLFNHGQGHAVPIESEQCIYSWFTEHLIPSD